MKIDLRLVSGTLLIVCVLSCCTKLESANDTFGNGPVMGAGAASGAGGLPTGGSSAGGPPAPVTGGTGGEAGASGAAGSNGDGDECIDPTGFQGAGCYRCEPTDIVTLEQACTAATCTGFDNSGRLTLLPSDGKLPELPEVSAAGQGGGAGTAAAPASATAGEAGEAGAAGFPGGGGAGAGSGGGTAGSSAATVNGGTSGVGVACSEVAKKGTLVYVTGSSAAKPFLQQIAQQLAGDGVYLVYTSTGSCIGVDAIVNGTPMTTGAAPAPAASATLWDSSASTGVACDLPADGVTADLGISDVFAQTCPGFEITDLDAHDIRDAHGPIQTMTFAVPTNSPYSEISAQAAYFVFGFGENGGVLDPAKSGPIWNDETELFQRSASSGTQAMLSTAIGVPPGRWKGVAHKTSDDVAADLAKAGGDEQSAARAIGIIAADYVDTKNLRAQIKVLAFQDTHAPCAVFPDSTGTAHDKQNVRDGHYPVWGPLHLLYKVDQAGNPVNDATRQQISDIVGYLSGTKALPNGVKLLDVYAQSGLVPECAMRVTRTSDGGDVTPHVPSNPCSCVFEAKATGSTACEPCMVQGDCASGQTCSQGYCEN